MLQNSPLKKEIAIIGMAGRFPLARNLVQFWHHLADGVDCIREIPPERWNVEKYYGADCQEGNKTYGRWGGFLADADDFDPAFFGIAPKEASLLDPQQRKILEVAYETMEDAGYGEKKLAASATGVFLGIMGRGFYDCILAENRELHPHLFTSSLMGFIPNRISYQFNLKGPSLAVDTLCSSSILAIHLACQSILSGESDMALAGGVYVHFSPQHYIMLAQMRVLSRRGRCRTFAENADGIVSGEGAGLVMLKELNQARRDGDHIHAVIKGTVVNSDGRSSRFTATDPQAQEDLVLQALDATGVAPESIDYIETHGTGTALGDPIELMALDNAFRRRTSRKAFCSLGSVKSNIGHLEPAAGIAGLLKLVLALQHQQIPPTLHVHQVNHYISLINSPFTINDKLRPWPRHSQAPRRAALSSFGMGGTNAHLIIEEAPRAKRRVRKKTLPMHLLTLAGKNPDAVPQIAGQFAAYLQERPETTLDDFCYTANSSRSHFPYRLAIIAADAKEMAAQLQQIAAATTSTPEAPWQRKCRNVRMVIAFADNDQIDFAPELYRHFSAFQKAVAQYRPLQKYFSGKPTPISRQVLLAGCAYACARLLLALGLEARAMIFTTAVGQYAALAAAGAINPATGLQGLANGQSPEAMKLDAGNAIIVAPADQFQSRQGDIVVAIDRFLAVAGWPDFYRELAELYQQGVDLAWEEIYPGNSRQRLALPTYPFQQKTYRLPVLPQQQSEPECRHPLVHRELCRSLRYSIYQTLFDTRLTAIIADHRVAGQAIVPGAVYIEMAATAFGLRYGQRAGQLTQVVLLAPLSGQNGSEVHTQLDEHNGSVAFVIASRGNDGGWTRHAEGRISADAETATPPQLDLEAIAARCPEELPLEAFYHHFHATGLDYGPWFRNLQQIHCGDQEILAKIKLNPALTETNKEQLAPPALLDAAWQAAVAFAFRGDYRHGYSYLPFSCQSLTIYAPLVDEGYAIVTLAAPPLTALKVHITLVDRQGRQLLAITGLTLKPTPTAQSSSNAVMPDWQRQIGDWFYRPCWQQSLPELPVPSPGRYLVFSAEHPMDAAIINQMQQSGLEIVRVTPGTTLTQIAGDHFQMPPGDEQAYCRLLDGLNSSQSWRGIINLWPAHAPQLDVDGGDANFAVYSVFFLVKALAQAKIRNDLSLLLVTDRAQAVLDPEKVANPHQATIWGLGRMLPLEFPGIRCRCVDIVATQPAPQLANAIITELASSSDSWVAYRDRQRYVWTLTPIKPEIDLSRCPFRSDGVYVIVGAGEIGLELARHLAQVVKAKVALLGRSPLPQKTGEIAAGLRQLVNASDNIAYFSVDITVAEAMAAVWAQITAQFGAITGVFHTAGILRDGLLKDKTRENFAQVLAPKVQGSYVLKQLVARQPVNFVVLFSSISAFIPNFGQGDYAAANTFLDAFAATPAATRFIAINWSYWQIGMSRGVQQSARNKGFTPLATAPALAALALAISLPYPQLTIAASQRSVTELGQVAPAPARPQSPTVADAATIQEAIADYLLTQLAELLECPRDSLDSESSFSQFGMDSILAVRFIETLGNEIKVDIDATVVFDYPGAALLAGHLLATFPEAMAKFGQQLSPAAVAPPSVSVSVAPAAATTALPPGSPAAAAPPVSPGKENVQKCLAELLAAILEVEEDSLDAESSFVEFGMDSILAVQYLQKLSEISHLELDATLVFDYPNLAQLADYLLTSYPDAQWSQVPSSQEANASLSPPVTSASAQQLQAPENSIDTSVGNTAVSDAPEPTAPALPSSYRQDSTAKTADIAIIGMSGRFAAAANPAQFWQNIAAGLCSIAPFPQTRENSALDVYHSREYQQRRGKLYGSYLENIDGFDPLFFEISPHEAEFMDPQQRLLLEVAWETIENAGYSKDSLSGSKTGVYVGACITEYAKFIDKFDPRAGTGNELAILANRISYLLNLRGPSITLDTACSSSLVALDLGCRAILSGACRMALVGGVNLILTPWFSIVFEKAGMLSADGGCKTFDDAANGYSRGEGAGMILLKLLPQALADRDHILAVIKGSAINQDGRSNGLTAPNALAQEQVILEAWSNAGIDPRTISLVEAHGTGTSLGDPIEIKGLIRAFSHFTSDTGFCAIGSVKTNIGHLEPAAGISALIKVILALVQRKLPPSLHFKRSNKLIDFLGSPFYLNDRLQNWPAKPGTLRRATISSFGFGGTNAHVVLEETPEPTAPSPPANADSGYLLPLSAKNQTALRDKARQLSDYLSSRLALADVAYTLGYGRDHFNHRLAVVASDIDAAITGFRQYSNQTGATLSGECRSNEKTRVAWYFGHNHRDDSSALEQHYPVFAAAIARCRQILAGSVVLPANWLRQSPSASHDWAIIARFVNDYALAQLLDSWGIHADALVSEGIGLITAACQAGSLSIEDALALVLSASEHQACFRQFTARLAPSKLKPAQVPLLTTGAVDVAAGQVPPEAYWQAIFASRKRAAIATIAAEKFPTADRRILLAFAAATLPLITPADERHHCLATASPGQDAGQALLTAVAHLYVSGVAIDWQQLYCHLAPRRVELPTYPFQRQRYWHTLAVKAATPRDQVQAPPLTVPDSASFFQRQWQPLASATPAQNLPDNGLWLVFVDQQEISEQMLAQLSQRHQIAVQVAPAYQFQRYSHHHYGINPLKADDYRELLAAVTTANGPIHGIIHLWTLGQPAGQLLERSMDTGVYSLFYLSQALGEYARERCLRLLTASRRHPLQFSVSEHTIPILSKIIGYEYKQVASRHISFAGATTWQEVTAAIAREIDTAGDLEQVSYHDGRRWAPDLVAVDCQRLPARDLSLTNQVVMITGGASGIGFEIAGHLARSHKVKLVLVGRSPLPPQSQWPQLLSNCAVDEPIALRIRNIQWLQQQGYAVVYQNADVTDAAAMQQVVETIRQQWGAISAIFHCAGVIDSQAISLASKSLDSLRQVLAPKVQGALVLAELIQNYDIPFTMFFSSLASLAGFTGVGFSDYAVANAFLDGMAAHIARKRPGRCVAVNWPVWTGIGMSNRGLATKAAYALTRQSALTALDQIMASNTPAQIIVSGTNLDAASQRRFRERAITPTSTPTASQTPLTIAPDAPAPLQPAAPDTNNGKQAERMLKQLLTKILKLESTQLDLHLNFSEYGMDSISIADFMGGIEAHYGQHFDPSLVLEYPTIAALAQFLNQRFTAPAQSSADIIAANHLDDHRNLAAVPVVADICRQTDAEPLSPQQELLRELYQGEISVEQALASIATMHGQHSI